MIPTQDPNRAAPAARLSIYNFLPITTMSEGVTLHIDKDNEDYYLEVAVDHSELALACALVVLRREGLELMDEDECPSTIDADGNVRSYLAEVIP